MSRLFRLAFRNVLRNRSRSILTLGAILVGVLVISVLRGFIVGTQDLLISDAVEGQLGALQIHRAGYLASSDAQPTRLKIPNTEDFVAKITAVPGVVALSPRIHFNGLVSNGRDQTLFIGRGIDPVLDERACPKAGARVQSGGRLLVGEDDADALVGFELGQSLDLVADPRTGKTRGEKSTVTIQTTSPDGRANALDFAVRGFTVSTQPFENKRVVSIPLKAAQALLGMEGQVNEFAIRIDQMNHLDRIASDLRKSLGPEFEVHTFLEVQPFVRDVIKRQDFVLGIIATVLFVIVLTVIINTMLMTVFERVKEIGTMLAVGMRRFEVLMLFLFEATILGLIGGAVGTTIALVILKIVHDRGISLQLSGTSATSILRPNLPPSYFLVSVVVATLGAMAAAAYPARRAAKLNPVDALRS